jgi:hypothetical protein
MRTDPRRALSRLAALALALPLAVPAQAQDRSKPWYAMDYGPCLSTTAEGFTADNVALKGRVVFLGTDAGVVFDTELLRVATAWTGGFLELRGTAFDGSHGPIPRVRGAEVCSTPQAPGWAIEGSFADPRPIPFGPLAPEQGRFLGHHLHGDEVVFRYEVAGREVLEHFEALQDAAGATIGIYRNFEFGPGAALRTVLADLPGAVGGAAEVEGGAVEIAQVTWGGRGEDEGLQSSLFVLVHGADGAKFVHEGGRVEFEAPAADAVERFRIAVWSAPVGEGPAEIALAGDPVDLAGWTRGGPRRYPEILETRGERGAGEGPFVVDTITVPETNPWQARLRFGAFDFVDEDTAALSTWNGDVWLVSGIDEDLGSLRWSRFCSGLHDPLGLKVVDGTIHVHGRDGIYRLRDLNDDGECDYVETFNNEVLITKGFHEFAFDLQTDAAGNFYFSKGGPVNPGGRGFQELVPHHGTVMRVGKDGSGLEVVATGVRAPNGIGVSADGVVTSGDNQGTWMPACRLNSSQNGSFWGCTDLAHRDAAPAAYDQPICWLPMAVDNSSGGQVWVPDGTWGPLGGMLLHQSYGQCNLYAVLTQEQDGRIQGGVVRIPAEFASSQMRARFHGEALYTVGFKGWQTRAARETAFQRVRRSAAPLRMPVGMRVFAGGIELRFADALEPETANDPESYEVEIWNYLWSEAYGSAEYRPSEPERKVRDGEQNRDRLAVTAARLGADGRTVLLSVDGLCEVMQTRIAYSLDAADGALVEGEIHGTIHFLPQR